MKCIINKDDKWHDVKAELPITTTSCEDFYKKYMMNYGTLDC